MAGYLLATVLAGIGALATMVGTGLALIGACCAGPALAAGGAAAVTAGATSTAADGGPYSWLFLTAGVVLGAAAFAVHHQVTRTATAAASSHKRPALWRPPVHGRPADPR